MGSTIALVGSREVNAVVQNSKTKLYEEVTHIQWGSQVQGAEPSPSTGSIIT